MLIAFPDPRAWETQENQNGVKFIQLLSNCLTAVWPCSSASDKAVLPVSANSALTSAPLASKARTISAVVTKNSVRIKLSHCGRWKSLQ
jgi:hypothetical protein